MLGFICKYVCNRKEEDVEQIQTQNFADRISDIKRRIAALESSIGRYEKPNKNTQTQSNAILAKPTESKTQESDAVPKESIDDIKAKLMAKRK